MCNYHWMLDTHNKQRMLQVYNKLDWGRAQDLQMMRVFWDRENAKNAKHYVLNLKREDLLEESVKKFVACKPVAGHDPLKLPLKIIFDKEAGIDEGGLIREYFKLIIEQLFKP